MPYGHFLISSIFPSILYTPQKVSTLWILHCADFMKRKKFLLSLESGNTSTFLSSIVWPTTEGLSHFLAQLIIITPSNLNGFTSTLPRTHTAQLISKTNTSK